MGRRRRSADESGPWAIVRDAPPAIDDPIEVLVARARKARRRGEERRAIVLLREACARDEWRARTWTLLGVHLGRAGSVQEAERALKHARWLRVRAGEPARAAVVERLLGEIAAAA